MNEIIKANSVIENLLPIHIQQALVELKESNTFSKNIYLAMAVVANTRKDPIDYKQLKNNSKLCASKATQSASVESDKAGTLIPVYSFFINFKQTSSGGQTNTASTTDEPLEFFIIADSKLFRAIWNDKVNVYILLTGTDIAATNQDKKDADKINNEMDITNITEIEMIYISVDIVLIRGIAHTCKSQTLVSDASGVKTGGYAIVFRSSAYSAKI